MLTLHLPTKDNPSPDFSTPKISHLKLVEITTSGILFLMKNIFNLLSY